MVASTRLYDILQVAPNAKDDEIKRAYKRQALKYHPDKAGPDGAEMFKKIQEANEILGDPRKRGLYDNYGDKGIQLIDSEMGAAMASMMDPKNVMCFILLGILLVLFISAFPVLLTIRVDGKGTWSWWWVFAPLITFFTIGSCISGVLLTVREEESGKRAIPLSAAAKMFCLLAFSILLPLGLSGKITSWPLVFIPLFILELISLIELPFALTRKAYERECAAREDEEDPDLAGLTAHYKESYQEYVAKRLSRVWRVVFTLLVMLKVSGSLTAPWSVVFIPVYVYMAYLYFSPIKSAIKAADGNIFPDLCLMGCCTLITVGAQAAFLILLIIKLSKGDEGPALAVVLIPIWIVLYCLIYCCCMQPLFMWKSKKDMFAEDEGQQNPYEGDVENPPPQKPRPEPTPAAAPVPAPAVANTEDVDDID